MVVNNMRVLLATAASCRVARIPSLATADLPLRGTGMPAADGLALSGAARVQVPTARQSQGTGVSSNGIGGGSPHSRQRDAMTLTEPTNHYFSTKQNVVVDDIPGVRSWSPPV